jgi:hypothetical protein
MDGKSFRKVLEGKTDTHKAFVFGTQTILGINNATFWHPLGTQRHLQVHSEPVS